MKNEELFARLADVGYPVGALSQLAQSGLRYAEAVPVLIEALEEGLQEDLDNWDDLVQLEWLARALSVPWAKKLGLDPLIRAFRQVPLGEPEAKSSYVRWAVGNALDVVWDDSRYDDLASLINDRRYGWARRMLVRGARKSKRPEVVDLLLGLLDDPDVSGYATEALSRMKDPKARPGLERMAGDKEAWVRKYAARGLERLDKLGL
jgi:HEAT repeat protein